NDQIQALSLHDALPISPIRNRIPCATVSDGRASVAYLSRRLIKRPQVQPPGKKWLARHATAGTKTKAALGCLECSNGATLRSGLDRKSTRLNSSHVKIS